MHKKFFLLLGLIYISSSANAANYVSEDLHTFLHSGPGTKYKIIGSVNAGQSIKVLQRDSGYTKVRDSKGRSGWINSKYVSNEVGLKERLPKLKNEVEQLKAKIAEDKISLDSNSDLVNKLENRNSKLNKELEEIQSINRNLNARLDTQKDDLLMRWFTYGGMVGGIGLILGLVLPLLIPKRRNKNRW